MWESSNFFINRVYLGMGELSKFSTGKTMLHMVEFPKILFSDPACEW